MTLKVSIITAVRNGAATITDCLQSVLRQTHPVEHIIVDSASSDNTIGLARAINPAARIISEPDAGVYDALNKGIKTASGDVIGFLHADDFYANDSVIADVVDHLERHNADSCYGDLVYVRKDDTEKVVRYWKSRPYRDGLFQEGWMPPHPTFFVRKAVYDLHGSFDVRFSIAADYELMLRFLEKRKISSVYIPEVLIKMRLGGMSNRGVRNMLLKTAEDYRAWSVNALARRFYTIPLKNISKLLQFWRANSKGGAVARGDRV